VNDRKPISSTVEPLTVESIVKLYNRRISFDYDTDGPDESLTADERYDRLERFSGYEMERDVCTQALSQGYHFFGVEGFEGKLDIIGTVWFSKTKDGPWVKGYDYDMDNGLTMSYL